MSGTTKTSQAPGLLALSCSRVVVYRGAHGTCHSIPIRELVVGDIVDIQQGDRVPADCILMEEMNIKVDQSMYFPGDVSVEKE